MVGMVELSGGGVWSHINDVHLRINDKQTDGFLVVIVVVVIIVCVVGGFHEIVPLLLCELQGEMHISIVAVN